MALFEAIRKDGDYVLLANGNPVGINWCFDCELLWGLLFSSSISTFIYNHVSQKYFNNEFKALSNICGDFERGMTYRKINVTLTRGEKLNDD